MTLFCSTEKNGVTMFSHWICFIGHYLRIILLERKCTKHNADVDKNIRKILHENGLFDEFIHIANISRTKLDE
jgi:hypothetical protein